MCGLCRKYGKSATDLLRLFAQRTDELTACKLVVHGFPNTLELNFDHVTGVTVRSDTPDEEDLRSLLLSVRLFVMKNEPTYILSVYNLCDLHLVNATWKEYLREARANWLRKSQTGSMQLNIDGVDYSPEQMFDLLSNGHYFHTDWKHHDTLERWLPLTNIVARSNFLAYVSDAIDQVIYIADIAKRSLDHKLVLD